MDKSGNDDLKAKLEHLAVIFNEPPKRTIKDMKVVVVKPDDHNSPLSLPPSKMKDYYKRESVEDVVDKRVEEATTLSVVDDLRLDEKIEIPIYQKTKNTDCQKDDEADTQAETKRITTSSVISTGSVSSVSEGDDNKAVAEAVAEAEAVRGSSLSLGENDLSLGENDLSLGENDLSLGENDLSLGENDLSLGENDLSLGENDLSLGDFSENESKNEKTLTRRVSAKRGRDRGRGGTKKVLRNEKTLKLSRKKEKEVLTAIPRLEGVGGNGKTSLYYAILFAERLTTSDIITLLKKCKDLTFAEEMALSLLYRVEQGDAKAEKIYWDLVKTAEKTPKTPIKQAKSGTRLEEALEKAENAIFGEIVE